MTMGNLLFISDLHGVTEGALYLRQRCSELEFGQCFVLGDSLEPYFSVAARNFLNELAPKVTGVRGNCDDEERVDPALSFAVGPRYVVSTEAIPGHELFCSHGDKWNAGNVPPQGDIIAFGHSHIPMLVRRECPGEEFLILFNPGSAGLPRGGMPATFGFFDQRSRELQIRLLEDGSILKSMAVD